MSAVPQLLVNLNGECVYASGTLAALLQCGLHELYGTGWRVRLSPYADRPFDAERAKDYAARKAPLRLTCPAGDRTIVTRIQIVTDPTDPTVATGFFGRVQLVRIHHRRAPTSAPSEIKEMTA